MLDISKRIRVQVEGQGEITLSPSEHVASGGEGHIWHKRGSGSGQAIKLWDDTARAALGRMEQRIQVLAALRHPCIVVPEALVRDSRGCIAGYVMPWVEGWALPLAFTNDWRAANSFGNDDALSITSHLRNATIAVHAQGIIQGDANELNIIGVGRKPCYIDVDSWVPPGFTGDKVLPTVLDPRSAPFSKEADWFTWAVVTFQLLVGIHPYRGTHPGFSRADTEGRMRAGASVFQPMVRLSPAVRPFSVVPPRLLEWYKSVFEGGLRSPPPDPMDSTSVVTSPVMKATQMTGRSGNLSVQHAYDCGLPSRVVGGNTLMLADGSLVSLTDGRSRGRVNSSAALSFMDDGTIISAWTEDGILMWSNLRGGVASASQSAGIACSAAWEAEGRIFARVADGIQEMQPRILGSRVMLLPGQKWALSSASSFLGEGVGLYSALRAQYTILPFGASAVALLRVRDLDGMRVLNGIRRGNVALLSLIDPTGTYRRATLVMNAGGMGVTVSLEDTDSGDLNTVVTETGLLVGFDNMGRLYIRQPITGASKVADAGDLSQGRLLAGGAGVFVWKDGSMSRVTLS